MAAGSPRRAARFLFSAAVLLQLPALPMFPLAPGGGAPGGEVADLARPPEFVSPLQVVLGLIGIDAERETPARLSAIVTPGALAREAANMAQCELNVGTCRPWPLFDWDHWEEIAQKPPFSPSELRRRLVATYPTKSREVYAGSVITLVAGLLSLVTSTRLAIVGVGVCIYGCLSEGHKLAPWVGVLVSMAALVSGLLDAPSSRQAAAATDNNEKKDS